MAPAPAAVPWLLLPLLASLLGTCAGTFRGTARATPVQKVVELLTALGKQVSAEGAKEAAEYDKFACFCKEQADEKLYAIDKSKEKLESLAASIRKVTSEASELDADIRQLGEEISRSKAGIDEEERARRKDFYAFEKQYKNVTDAIQAVQAATEAIEVMKGKVTGDADLDLRQVEKVVTRAFAGSLATTGYAAIQNASHRPHAYKLRSKSILSTFAWMQSSFKENKRDLYEMEMRAKSASQLRVKAMQNELDAKKKSKLEKEALSSEKVEAKSNFEKEKDQETKDKASDVKFNDELEKQCKSKAEQWDSRSKARSSEIAAISEATAILKSGVPTSEKLAGLISVDRKPVSRRAGRAASVSFLQLRGASELASRRAVAVQRAAAQVAQAASHLRSSELTALGSKLALQDDHFEKVRGLIKDLLDKLENAATDEADSKSFCDEEMQKTVDSRDRQSSKIEESAATIKAERSKKDQLKREIAESSRELAQTSQALREAGLLRSQEEEDNEQTIAEAEAGKQAVEQAIAVLESFYKVDFAQLGKAAPATDRDGNSVGDSAPETSFSGEYEGKQDASKGIMGLLNVIASDFARSKSTVTAEEQKAVKAFKKFTEEAQGVIATLESKVKAKEGEVAAAAEAVVSARDDLETASGLKESALKELNKLKPMCAGKGEEAFADRAKMRVQEIESLKGALKALREASD